MPARKMVFAIGNKIINDPDSEGTIINVAGIFQKEINIDEDIQTQINAIKTVIAFPTSNSTTNVTMPWYGNLPNTYLNNILSPGFYKITVATTGGPITTGINADSAILLVMPASSSRNVQIMFHNNGNIYYRVFQNNIFTTWTTLGGLNYSDIFDIGHILETTNPNLDTVEKVNARYPGTTWEVFAPGRFLLGMGANVANTTTTYGSISTGAINRIIAEKGGSNYLTTAQLASHRHTQYSHNHLTGTRYRRSVTGDNEAFGGQNWASYTPPGGTAAAASGGYTDRSNQRTEAVTPPDMGLTGSGSAVLPPYETVYRYRRIA